jgi:hypothetical protein
VETVGVVLGRPSSGVGDVRGTAGVISTCGVGDMVGRGVGVGVTDGVGVGVLTFALRFVFRFVVVGKPALTLKLKFESKPRLVF